MDRDESVVDAQASFVEGLAAHLADDQVSQAAISTDSFVVSKDLTNTTFSGDFRIRSSQSRAQSILDKFNDLTAFAGTLTTTFGANVHVTRFFIAISDGTTDKSESDTVDASPGVVGGGIIGGAAVIIIISGGVYYFKKKKTPKVVKTIIAHQPEKFGRRFCDTQIDVERTRSKVNDAGSSTGYQARDENDINNNSDDDDLRPSQPRSTSIQQTPSLLSESALTDVSFSGITIFGPLPGRATRARSTSQQDDMIPETPREAMYGDNSSDTERDRRASSSSDNLGPPLYDRRELVDTNRSSSEGWRDNATPDTVTGLARDSTHNENSRFCQDTDVGGY